MRPLQIDFIDDGEIGRRLKALGCDDRGVPYFLAKRETLTLLLKDVDTRAANALKQEMLARGGDVAVHRNAIDRQVERTDCLLFGTEKAVRLLVEKLKAMPYWGLEEVRLGLTAFLASRRRGGHSRGLDLPGGRRLSFEGRSLIMGILNVTADSFYAGSRIADLAELLERAETMVAEGADILDVGAESTRPGSDGLDAATELVRLVPALRALRERFPDLPLSADTNKASVAEAAVAAGADIVNDISGFGFDGALAETVAALAVPVVVMHIQGRPRTMQEAPRYGDLLPDMVAYFEDRLALAARSGIDESRIILDPGIGFGKTSEHNLEILRHLEALRGFGLPLLVGHSRKSFLGAVLDEPRPEGRLEGTLAVSALCAWRDVEILRVHDVGASRKAVDVVAAVRRGSL